MKISLKNCPWSIVHGPWVLFFRTAFCLCLWTIVYGLSTPSAWAALSLEVDPIRGGRDIRFETARPGRPVRNEEVRFTLTNDQPDQRYQLTYSLLSPITSDRGRVLPAERIKMFSPTSVPGVLRTSLLTPLRQGAEIMYTSEPSGTGTEFIVIFAFEPTGEEESGIYNAQISYTLEAVNGGVSPVMVVRNIRLEVASDLQVHLRNRRGAQALDLGRITDKTPSGEDTLTLEVRSGGRPFRVTQTAARFQNAEGETIDSERISWQTGDGRTGMLSESPQAVYLSDGSTETVELQYRLDAAGEEAAGNYQSVLVMTVDVDGAPPQTFNLPASLEIMPIFKLTVENPEGGTLLRFGEYKAGEPYKTQTVKLTVLNNTGQAYQVTQVSDGPLVNEQGGTVPEENFTVQTQPTAGPTEYAFVGSSAVYVNKGNTVLFVSGPRGKSTELNVEYNLTLPAEQIKGRYTTSINYSLSSVN